MRKHVAIVMFSLSIIASEAWSLHLGIGTSTVSDGRAVPAINLGFEPVRGYLISGMSAGIQSKSYFFSLYNCNLLLWQRMGKGKGGSVWAGIGGGILYGRKGMVVSREPTLLKEDSDFMVGPAFRLAWHPIPNIYLGVEFTLGFGGSFIAGAAGDAGLVMIGGAI